MNDPMDRIGMVRVTGRVFNEATTWPLRDTVNQLQPMTGDVLIIKAHPSRIAALEANLRAQLIPQGLVE